MEEPSGSYAPQSPDLSGVSYYPNQPPSSYYSHPHQQPPQQAHAQLPYSSHEQDDLDPFQPQTVQPHEHLPAASYYSHPPPGYPYPPHPHQPQNMPVATRASRVKPEDPDWLPPAAMSNPVALPATASPFAPLGADEKKLAPGEADGIVVRTKFPVARIKRIVQADEDIGKVAQVTPVVVAKALELFMISLTTKSADEARARGSKKITGAHLKQAVQKDEQFDFLNDIVSKIADAPSARKEREDDSDDAADGGASVKRKKPAASKRKRKDPEDS